MVRLFLDSSVLIAAMGSRTGASYAILKCADQQRVEVFVSDFVLLEVKMNVQKRLPALTPIFDKFANDFPVHHVIHVSLQAAKGAAQYTHTKDAPVVAAAQQAQVDYLVSLDRQHLLDNPELERESGLKIREPGVVIHLIRQQEVA